MTNNDILRRIRSIFDLSDTTLIEIFELAGVSVSQEQVISWLRKDTDQKFHKCSDSQLATFLNGFINHRRGKKEGAQAEPEQQLTNNIIFRKLKIALDLQAEDVLEILDLVNICISKHELSALFRKPGHKHYRECDDRILQGFLDGVRIMYNRNVQSETD